MTILTEGPQRGEAITFEECKEYSRSVETIILGQNLKAMTVLGKITASGKYTQLAPAAADGSQNAVAILFDNVDATAADKKGVIMKRMAMANGAELVWPTGITAPQKSTAIASLEASGIIVR